MSSDVILLVSAIAKTHGVSWFSRFVHLKAQHGPPQIFQHFFVANSIFSFFILSLNPFNIVKLSLIIECGSFQTREYMRTTWEFSRYSQIFQGKPGKVYFEFFLHTILIYNSSWDLMAKWISSCFQWRKQRTQEF